MQTSPCGHRVVCRKCFVKTIQMAVSQRLLPLRCVICRAKILRLKQSSGHGGLSYSKSWLMPSSASSYSMSTKSWSAGSSKHCWNDKNWVPSSASQYSMTSRNVPNSASMYSMTSGSSSLSGKNSPLAWNGFLLTVDPHLFCTKFCCLFIATAWVGLVLLHTTYFDFI